MYALSELENFVNYKPEFNPNQIEFLEYTCFIPIDEQYRYEYL